MAKTGFLARRIRFVCLALGGFTVAFLFGTMFFVPVFSDKSFWEQMRDTQVDGGEGAVFGLAYPFDYITTYAPPSSFGADGFTEQRVNWSWVDNQTTYVLTRDNIDVTPLLMVNFSTVFGDQHKYSYSFVADAQGYFQMTLTFNSLANSSWIDESNHTVWFNYSDGSLFYNFSDIWEIVGQFDSSFTLVDGVFRMVLGRQCNKNTVVVLDPTFGNEGTDSTGDLTSTTLSGRHFMRGWYFSPAFNGIADNITIKTSTMNDDLLVQCAIYEYVDASSDYAGDVIAWTEEKTILLTEDDTIITFDLPDGVNVVAGTNYYLFVIARDCFDSTNLVKSTGGYTPRVIKVSDCPYTNISDDPLTGELYAADLSGTPYIYCSYTTVMDTEVDAVSPYWQDSVSNVGLSATSNSEPPSNVSLFYRHSYDNNTWGNSDPVDWNGSNNDSSADKGTESNFAYCQDTFPDFDNMTLTETDYGTAVINDNKNVDGWGTAVAWSTTGTTPYIDAKDYSTNYISASKNTNSGWATYADTTATSGNVEATVYVNMWAAKAAAVTVYWDLNGDGVADGDSGAISISTGTSTYYPVSIGSITYTQANALRCYFRSGSTTTTYYIDHSNVSFYRAATTDYELDMEYQFNTTTYTNGSEYICFYLNDTVSENLVVEYYQMPSWVSLGTISNSGWTNLTATGLTNSTYNIRLTDANQTNEVTQHHWDIDVMKLNDYNWSLWDDPSNPDTGSPWAWTFDCPNETGFYEFYSIGKKAGYDDESAPTSADSRCHVNYTAGDTRSWYTISTFNGTVYNQSSWYQHMDWNGTLWNQSYYDLLQDINGTVYNQSIYNQILNWNGTIYNQSIWVQQQDYSGSIYNISISEWNIIIDFNGTIFNQSLWSQTQEFNGTIFNQSTYVVSQDINGSIWNQSYFDVLQDINGTIYNQTSYGLVSEYNGTIYNSTEAILIQDINGTLWNQSLWSQLQEYNGTIYNSSIYNQIMGWNGTIYNSTAAITIQEINGSIYNQSFWTLIQDYNGTIYNQSIYTLMQSWNGSIYNTTGTYTQTTEWNGTLYNQSTWDVLQNWNGTVFNQTIYNQIQEWNGSIYNETAALFIQSWNGTVTNTSQYHTSDIWNGTVFNTSSHILISEHNGTIYNQTVFNQIQEYNGSIYNSTATTSIQEINGTLWNQSSWYLLREINGTIYNQSIYTLVSDFNGTIYNTTGEYTQILEYNGSIYNLSIWDIIQDMNGTIYNQSIWDVIYEYNGTIYNSSIYNQILSWNGTIYNYTLQWVISTFNGTIWNSSRWYQQLDYNGSIYNQSTFKQINNYNGTIYNSTIAVTINNWNGTIYNYTGANLVSEINGSIYNQSFWIQRQNWNGSLYNSSSMGIITTWDGTIYNQSVATAINVFNGTIYNLSEEGYITLSNPYPVNNSGHVSMDVILNITVSHYNGSTMNITWYWGNSSGNCSNYLGSTLSVGNGTYYMHFAAANISHMVYYWSVNCSDGYVWENDTFVFTTGRNASVSAFMLKADRFNVGLLLGFAVMGVLGVFMFVRRRRRRGGNQRVL